MEFAWLIYQVVVTAVLIGLLLNTINNIRLLSRPIIKSLPEPLPLVSVVVPARNEARNIANCVKSLAQQNYPHIEILVLDDQSEDSTVTIVEELALRYSSVRLIHGQSLPLGWSGKAFACHQASQLARGDLLLFVDADAILDPECISTTVRAASQHQADLLTLIPHILTKGLGEALIMPLTLIVFGAFLPMALVMNTSNPLFAGALGSFLLFRREKYMQIGGHEAVRGDIVEDLALSRLVRQTGGRQIWIDGSDLMQARFYHGFRDAWRGFSKSAFPLLGYSLSIVSSVIFMDTSLFIFPYLFLIAGILTHQFSTSLFWLPCCQILLAWTFRLLLAWRFHMRRISVVLHAATILIGICFTLHSAYQVLFGSGIPWKGRTYQFRNHSGIKTN